MVWSLTTVILKDKNTYLLMNVIGIYEQIAIATTTIPLPRPYTNYQFTMSIGYYLMEIFYSVSNFGDINLAALRSMASIAISSIENGGSDVMTLSNYSKIVANSEQIRDVQFYRLTTVGITRIINHSIEKKVAEIPIRQQIEHMTEVSMVVLRRLKEDDAYAALQPVLDTSPGFSNNLYMMISRLLALKLTEQDEFLMKRLERHAFDLIPFFNKCLIKITRVAAERKNFFAIKDLVKCFYLVIIKLVKEELILQLSLEREVRVLFATIFSVFKKYFDTNEQLDSNEQIFEEVIDMLTVVALDCTRLGKYHLTNLIAAELLEFCFHISKFDEFGYSAPEILKRIMMLGIQAVELNSESVFVKVLELLRKYDTDIPGIAKEFQPRVDVDKLKEEIEEYDSLFETNEISPKKKYLKEGISEYAWSKFRIMMK